MGANQVMLKVAYSYEAELRDNGTYVNGTRVVMEWHLAAMLMALSHRKIRQGCSASWLRLSSSGFSRIIKFIIM